MAAVELGLLEITPDPRRATTRLPLLGPAYDRRTRAVEDDAFARAERAVLEAVGRDEDAVLYPHSFRRNSAATKSSADGLPMGTALAGVLFACGPFADALLDAFARPYQAARIAVIAHRSVVLATPTRWDVVLRKIALADIRAVVREGDDVVLKMAGQEVRIEGLAQPKRFVEEARRCIARHEERPAVRPTVRAADADASEAADGAEVAAIRRRLRARGWMLAVANDYRLKGRWHVFYSFAHPDGLSAKGEGTSDLAALRLAEADVLATEARYGLVQEHAA